MKILFMFLCGILYLIGIPFGWSYETTSIYVCIYLWPILCCLSTLPILFISLKYLKKNFFIGSFLSIFSILYLLSYIGFTLSVIERYNIKYKNSFMNCMIDLKDIAHYYGISYETLNILIYVVGFLGIILINYCIYKSIKYFYNYNKSYTTKDKLS